MNKSILLAGAILLGSMTNSWGLTLTPSVEQASSTWPAGSSFYGYTSTTDDPLGPFNGDSVHFRGTETGGALQVYRYRLDFDLLVELGSIVVEGVGWASGGPVPVDEINLFDEAGSLITAINALGDSVGFQSVLIPGNSAIGRTFFLEETNGDGNFRYRSNIVVNASVVPIPTAAWLFGSGLLVLIGIARRKAA